MDDGSGTGRFVNVFKAQESSIGSALPWSLEPLDGDVSSLFCRVRITHSPGLSQLRVARRFVVISQYKYECRVRHRKTQEVRITLRNLPINKGQFDFSATGPIRVASCPVLYPAVGTLQPNNPIFQRKQHEAIGRKGSVASHVSSQTETVVFGSTETARFKAKLDRLSIVNVQFRQTSLAEEDKSLPASDGRYSGRGRNGFDDVMEFEEQAGDGTAFRYGGVNLTNRAGDPPPTYTLG
ncbi:hypothetical protein QFC20_006441 [Naganishia adeliensis]|uniref:Uncharacterized protein n=1 Tax=Naganishia adeliensis TaxID=92952 RepID=A0ACC2VB53_9TREE|nr:hypothetical protein QFC20_006441 [Naganishia adeliensis]